ncbi:MAG: preprotein translocase subunit SecE [Actinomycetia bacterium]|nr:preprotein translocase subunit SecE [Actinomycetes bacterium]
MAKDKENKKSSKQSSPGVPAKIIGYFKGVVQELKRVTWPTPKDMLNSGIIVVATLIFFALFTFAFDSAATKGVTALANTTASKTTTATPNANETTVTPSLTATGTSK